MAQIDVFFLLNLHKKYNTILIHLNEIVNIYDEMLIEHTDSFYIVEEQRKYYLKKIDRITETITNITKNIQGNCVHEFVNDSIDIDCERSQNITYCTICEYTKC